MGKKLTYKYVSKYFDDNGCELIDEEYVNNSALLNYWCSCGNKSKISFSHFSRGSRCVQCGCNKISKSKRYDVEKVRQIFSQEGCKLLSDDYRGQNYSLLYKCSCGEVSETTLNTFVKGHRCIKCGSSKSANSRRYTFEEVKNIFRQNNCELLSKKYNSHLDNLSYECLCGDISRITLARFMKGQRCKKCGIRKISGENSYNWNFNITQEERVIKRAYAEYKEWRNKVYVRDMWSCQKCKRKGKIYLNAHHVENYSSRKDLRLVVSNGETLCDNCHKEFHKKYTRKNNNREQFNEFIGVA